MAFVSSQPSAAHHFGHQERGLYFDDVTAAILTTSVLATTLFATSILAAALFTTSVLTAAVFSSTILTAALFSAAVLTATGIMAIAKIKVAVL